MHWGVNCLLKHLNLDVFIKWVILFEGLLTHPNLLVLLCSLRKAISLEFQLLFCLVVWLQIQRLLFTQHLLLKHDVESPFNLLSVHFCVCQLPPNTFWVCHRAFTRVTCWWWIENNSVCPSVVLWESRADNAGFGSVNWLYIESCKHWELAGWGWETNSSLLLHQLLVSASFPTARIFCDLFLGFVPPQKLVNTGFCVGVRPLCPSVFLFAIWLHQSQTPKRSLGLISCLLERRWSFL